MVRFVKYVQRKMSPFNVYVNIATVSSCQYNLLVLTNCVGRKLFFVFRYYSHTSQLIFRLQGTENNQYSHLYLEDVNRESDFMF